MGVGPDEVFPPVVPGVAVGWLCNRARRERWVQRPSLHYLLSTSASRTVTSLVVVAGIFLPIIGAELLRSRREGKPSP